MHRSRLLLFTFLLLVTIIASACAPAPAGQASAGKSPAMAAVSALPKEMQSASARVRSAYQFAVANPGALEAVPCYCGCGAMGHTSNLSCFIQDRKADGQIEFDQHALGCSLCVDIAQDVMRMTGEGKPPTDIHAAIVNAYSKFGPGNQ